jgi:uncharacterized RDD family membrane protein YckC
MLEQKEINEITIEELKDIENKEASKSEKLAEVSASEECPSFENSIEDKVSKPNFIDAFKASLIDLVVIGGISTIGVFGADALLRLTGYGIIQKFQMAFIVYMVVMVLYMSFMESGKNSATLGKKIAGLIITKG